jgi:hypothetical protein
MRITQTIAVMGLFAAAITVACSDSGPLQPEALKKTLAAGSTAGGGTDTAGHTPPDTGRHTGPDTVGAGGTQNFDPRNIVGVVKGVVGNYPDSVNDLAIAGATLILTTLDDSVAGIPGKELARAISASDGSFALGAFKPGPYEVHVTPPAGSPFRALPVAGFVIMPNAPPTYTLRVWLNKK